MGHNELLIAEALKDRPRDDVVLSVKFGAQRGPDGSWLGFDGRPAAVKTALAYTLNRLGVDHIDIYRPARLDPDVPIEDTIGAIADVVQAGYVRHIGLSEVGSDTIRRAAAVHPHRRPADRIQPALARDRGRRPADHARARDRDHGLWRAQPRPDRRQHPALRRPRRLPRLQPALPGRQPAEEPGPRRRPGRCRPRPPASPPPRPPSPGSRPKVRTSSRWWAPVAASASPRPSAPWTRPSPPRPSRVLEAAVPKDAAAGARYAEVQMAHLDSEEGLSVGRGNLPWRSPIPADGGTREAASHETPDQTPL